MLEKGDSQRVAMTTHFQVQTFEVRTLFQVVYYESKVLLLNLTCMRVSKNRFKERSENIIGGCAIIGCITKLELPVKYPRFTSASIIIVSPELISKLSLIDCHKMILKSFEVI